MRKLVLSQTRDSVLIRLMGDIRFSCSACGQSLVTDRSGAGLLINCPHCAQPVQIPYNSAPAEDPRLRDLISSWSDRAAALTAEVEQLTSRLADSEAARTKSDAAFHAASADLIKARKLIETLQAENNQSSGEVEQLNGEIAKLRPELAAIQTAQAEAHALIERQRTALAESETRTAALQTEREVFEKDLAAMKTSLAGSRKETAALRVEYAKLCSQVAKNHDLAESIELRRGNEKLDLELREARASLAELNQKLEVSERQRGALRDRSVELELKLAATREALSESQLAQDNEILRRLVERINEELKERSPAQKKAPVNPHGILGSIVALWRSLWTRSIVASREI